MNMASVRCHKGRRHLRKANRHKIIKGRMRYKEVIMLKNFYSYLNYYAVNQIGKGGLML